MGFSVNPYSAPLDVSAFSSFLHLHLVLEGVSLKLRCLSETSTAHSFGDPAPCRSLGSLGHPSHSLSASIFVPCCLFQQYSPGLGQPAIYNPFFAHCHQHLCFAPFAKLGFARPALFLPAEHPTVSPRRH
jgi:hypothetical protein